MTRKALRHKFLPYLRGKKITPSVIKKYNEAVKNYKLINPEWKEDSIV